MMRQSQRIVITGVGLTSPNANNYTEFRQAVLDGRSGVKPYEIRYIGKTIAGLCQFNETKYRDRKALRRGTRAGSISVWCAGEALADAGLTIEPFSRAASRYGVIIGITEHGNVETEDQVYEISKVGYDVKYWTHHHNPRTVANNPAGEVCLNWGITGLHYTVGGACAGGNLGIIHGCQQLRLGEIDVALCGGVSESPRTFGIFAGFKSQNALASHDDPAKASRPFDRGRNGIVISEGGALFVLERLEDALARNARILGEIAGYASNTDATDFVLPNADRQTDCMRIALDMAEMTPDQIDIVSSHGTATPQGDIAEAKSINALFTGCDRTYVNNTKSMSGHSMGAAGALELAGNLPAFNDGLVHPTINCENPDPEALPWQLVIGTPKSTSGIRTVLNNSFGMLGINSTLIVKKFDN